MTVTEPRAQERSQAAEFVDFFARGLEHGSGRATSSSTSSRASTPTC